jgi:hypothetical protein
MQGDIGCLSHWGIQDIDKGFVFLSQQGPAICWGSYITLIQGAENILNLFEANDPSVFNLSSTKYATSFCKETKKQVGWGVSSTSATVRDLVLMYDYEKNIFWLNDSVQANYFARITDTNGTAQVWSGDYSGQVFQHDTGTNDNGSAINWYWKTPHISLMGVGQPAMLRKVEISGQKQSAGTLYIDLYLDQSSTPAATYTVDMTTDQFTIASNVYVDRSAEWFQLGFRNSELDVPVKITGMHWHWQEIGHQI